MMMENAALNAIKPYLDASESALGTRVDVLHSAATPVGRSVTAHAEVTAVDGRRIEFRIDAEDGIEQIGTGIHERMIIDRAKFAIRLKSKLRIAIGTPPAVLRDLRLRSNMGSPPPRAYAPSRTFDLAQVRRPIGARNRTIKCRRRYGKHAGARIWVGRCLLQHFSIGPGGFPD